MKLKEIVRDGNLIASRSLDDYPSFCGEKGTLRNLSAGTGDGTKPSPLRLKAIIEALAK